VRRVGCASERRHGPRHRQRPFSGPRRTRIGNATRPAARQVVPLVRSRGGWAAMVAARHQACRNGSMVRWRGLRRADPALVRRRPLVTVGAPVGTATVVAGGVLVPVLGAPMAAAVAYTITTEELGGAVMGTTFMSRDLAGNETAVELRRPGGELRFSLGGTTHGGASAWRRWTGRAPSRLGRRRSLL
jgi:hypothetical protein